MYFSLPARKGWVCEGIAIGLHLPPTLCKQNASTVFVIAVIICSIFYILTRWLAPVKIFLKKRQKFCMYHMAMWPKQRIDVAICKMRFSLIGEQCFIVPLYHIPAFCGLYYAASEIIKYRYGAASGMSVVYIWVVTMWYHWFVTQNMFPTCSVWPQGR